MDLYTVIGLAGVVAYVAAYSLLQLGLLDGNGLSYSVANVLAASLVLVSLTDDFNLASAITQVIWITIGMAGIATRYRRHRMHLPTTRPASATTSVGPGAPSAPHAARTNLGLRADTVPAAGRAAS